MKRSEKIFLGLSLIFLIGLVIIKPTRSVAGCVERNVTVNGTSSFFYNGTLVNTGIVNITGVEKQDRGSNGTISNGEWTIRFNACTDNIEFITVRISDNSNNIGFNQLKISPSNVSTNALTCTQQNVTLAGFAVNLTSGASLAGGVVRGSIHDTIYTNATTFTGDRWEVKLNSCLISGKIYTLSAFVSDTNNIVSGEYYTSYAAN